MILKESVTLFQKSLIQIIDFSIGTARHCGGRDDSDGSRLAYFIQCVALSATKTGLTVRQIEQMAGIDDEYDQRI